jgi:hypothetical protein
MSKFNVGDIIWNSISVYPYFLITDITYKNTPQTYTVMNMATGELYPMTYENAHRMYSVKS